MSVGVWSVCQLALLTRSTYELECVDVPLIKLPATSPARHSFSVSLPSHLAPRFARPCHHGPLLPVSVSRPRPARCVSSLGRGKSLGLSERHHNSWCCSGRQSTPTCVLWRLGVPIHFQARAFDETPLPFVVDMPRAHAERAHRQGWPKRHAQ